MLENISMYIKSKALSNCWLITINVVYAVQSDLTQRSLSILNQKAEVIRSNLFYGFHFSEHWSLTYTIRDSSWLVKNADNLLETRLAWFGAYVFIGYPLVRYGYLMKAFAEYKSIAYKFLPYNFICENSLLAWLDLSIFSVNLLL